MALEFAHAVVYVVDMEEMVDFYTNVLGFTVTDRGPIGDEGSPEILFMSTVADHHHQLAFLSVREEAKPSNSVNHLAFRTSDLASVKATIAALEGDGRATRIGPLSHGNAWSVYFNDPEENGVEIFCDSPFHVAQPQGKPWDPSLDEDELIERTKAEFGDEPRFGPIADFYASQRETLGG